MPSHSDLEIPFSISHKHAPLRLLELPAELVDALKDDSSLALRMKSAVSGDAVLCTADKTYQMRQVQTSNSLYVVSASAAKDANGSTQSGLTTLAQCNWSLEVSNATSLSALPYLRQALPLYTGQADKSTADISRTTTKSAVFADVPLSDGECEQAWTELIAFERGENKLAFRPAATALIKAWSSISLLAIDRSIDLSETLRPTDIEDVTRHPEEMPMELAIAIVKRLLPKDQQRHMSSASVRDLNPSTTFNLDRSQTVSLVGQWLLESTVETTQAELLRQWQNLMPERWREDVTLSLIEGFYETVSNGKIAFISPLQQHDSSNQTATSSTSASKRKWHEKFAQARKR